MLVTLKLHYRPHWGFYCSGIIACVHYHRHPQPSLITFDICLHFKTIFRYPYLCVCDDIRYHSPPTRLCLTGVIQLDLFINGYSHHTHSPKILTVMDERLRCNDATTHHLLPVHYPSKWDYFCVLAKKGDQVACSLSLPRISKLAYY